MVSCGVHSAAVILAHAVGAHNVFTVSGKERIARVTALGGTVGADYKKEDFLAAVMEATNVVIAFVESPYLDRNLRACAHGKAHPGRIPKMVMV